MSIYSDKLTHVQVVINCLYSVAQFCTGRVTLAHISGSPPIVDLMSYNFFLNVGSLKESIFLTTFYGLYWSKQDRMSNGLEFE